MKPTGLGADSMKVRPVSAMSPRISSAVVSRLRSNGSSMRKKPSAHEYGTSR